MEGALGYTLTDEEHWRLRDILMKTHGKWILTYNDCPEVRALYERCRIEEVISEVNVKEAGKKAKFWRQLIITKPSERK